MNTIVSQFNIQGNVVEVAPLGNGLINTTYRVKTEGNAPDCKQSECKRTQGNQSECQHSDGEHPEGQQPERTHAAREKSNREYPASLQADGEKAVCVPSDMVKRHTENGFFALSLFEMPP